MATKLKIIPQFGTFDNSKNIKFEITGLSNKNDIRIKIENATNSINANIQGCDEYLYIEKGVSNYNGVINLNIPEQSSQLSISIFVNIEEKQSDNSYKIIEIIPAIYHIENQIKDLFDGDIHVSSSYINPEEVCTVNIRTSPDKKTILSINDKRFSIISNPVGLGSINFRGKDILDNKNIGTVQKFPIYFHSYKDNFVKKYFSNSYLNILPNDVKVSADEIDPRCETYDPNTWTPPFWCFETPEEEVHYCNPQLCIPVKTGDEDKNYDLGLVDVCRINSSSITLLPNGTILHAFVGIDKTIITGVAGYNINRVFIDISTGSANVKIIANRDVILTPKMEDSDFEIIVDIEVYNILTDFAIKEYYALIYDGRFGYQCLKVINRMHDDLNNDYRIILAYDDSSEITETLNASIPCTNVVFYENNVDPDTTSLLDLLPDIEKLPFIKDSSGDEIQIFNVSVACNSDYLSDDGKVYVYVIAEAFIEAKSQLFLYSFILRPTASQASEVFGWE